VGGIEAIEYFSEDGTKHLKNKDKSNLKKCYENRLRINNSRRK
jgi:hypothetical protein